jgi:hypothetical protein
MKVRWAYVKFYLIALYNDLNEADFRSLWEDLKQVDLNSPMPPYDTVSIPNRLPTLDDLDEIPDDQKYLWTGRIVRGSLNLLASNPKMGKSSLLLWLERLLWFGVPTPGSDQLVYPEKTRSLWLLGDDNADEIRDRARSFGIPGTAIQLCSSPDDPHNHFTLDQDVTLKTLEHFIANEDYGMVVVDSALRTTRKRMWDSGDVDDVWKPIIRIARQANVALVATLHTSREGESLGRRLEGVARSISKLHRVGKDTPESVRRKLTTVINRAAPGKDPVLTIYGDRIEFSEYSIAESDTEPKKRGRPSAARDMAKGFIRQSLSTGPTTWDEIKCRWDGDRMTLVRARQDLQKSHEVRVTGQEDEERLELL